MGIVLKTAEGEDRKFETGELLSIKGVILKIHSLQMVQPFEIKLQPANEDQIKEYYLKRKQ